MLSSFRRARLGAALCLAAMAATVGAAAGCGGGASTSAPSAGAKTTAASTAAGGATAASSTTANKPLKKVTMRFSWTIGGYDVPFCYGKALGIFKAAGFDIDNQPGKGSSVTTETVGNGSDTFGFADAGTAAKLISKGEKVKVLGVFVQDSPMSFIHNPDVKINSPKDLVGHPIITSAGDADKQILPAVLAKAGMKLTDLHFDMVDPSAYAATFVKTPGAVMLGFNDDDLQNVQKLDPKAIATPYSQFGVNTFNEAVITSDSMIKNHPDEVRAFMAATVKSWEATIKNPTAAVAATLKAFPIADKTDLTEGLAQTLKLLHTPASQGHPLGWMAQSDWKETLQVLHDYTGMEKILPLDDYYTNDYLPKS